MLHEGEVIALQILHAPAHSRKAFAEAEVVGGVGLGRLTLCPIPVPAVLQIDDIDLVPLHDWPLRLKAEIVHATETFLEYLRPHDGCADGEYDAVVQPFNGAAEKLEIDRCRSADHRAIEHRVIRNDVVANPWMNGQRNVVTEGLGED